MAFIVFDALDVALLVDRPGLRAMLEDEQLFRDAAGALTRIGPPAVDFAGWLFDRLNAKEDVYDFEGAQALGSIGRDDPNVIDGLLRRLRSGREPVRIEAAMALGHAGPPLAGRLEVAIDLLMGATYEPSLAYAATEALASVGRFRKEALGRVLELAAPRPPRWMAQEYAPDGRIDEVMNERGVAIVALPHFLRFADQVVPVLVEAFDSFEEYDPDWCYGGEHGRVCWALKAFGPEAATAVSRLTRYLEQWRERSEDDCEWPGNVLELLTAIGLSAAPALPVLERMRADLADEDGKTEPLDPDDALDRAILAIRGEI